MKASARTLLRVELHGVDLPASAGTGGVLTGASRTSAARSCASPRSTSDCVGGREP